MRKLQMAKTNTITFEEGCNKYLDDCRQRNLREATIKHYKQSYTQFYKYFNPQMPITEMTQDVYKQFVMHLRETLHNDVSINAYLRDMITTLHFLMNEGYLHEKHLRLQIVGSITLDCRNGKCDPMSEAFLQMAGVFSQLELAMIRARVRSGMENVRAKGANIGRPQVTAQDIPASFAVDIQA